MLVSPSEMYKHCYGRYAIAAINIWSMEQVDALFIAGRKSKAPFIVQMTPVALHYGHQKILLAIIKAAGKMYPEVVYSIHLDHGTRDAAIKAINSGGFSSVMIDASHEPFEKNVSLTREVVDKAHGKHIEVEAELGVLSGVEDDLEIANHAATYTRPREAEDFIAETGCDSLAIAIGTSHGAYKFTGEQSLQFDILKEIQDRLPGFPLVLHGGSSINSTEVKRINASGGNLGSGTSGVPSLEIKKAITYGICKVNIATDARIIWTRVHREYFNNHPEQFDPVPPGRIYMDELEKLYIEKFNLLGATNKAEDFQR